MDIKPVSNYYWLATEAAQHYESAGEFIFALYLAGLRPGTKDMAIIMEVFSEAAKERRFKVKDE